MDQPRASKLVAAAAGRRVSAEIHGFRREFFARAMDGWTDTDRAEFARLLTSFVASLGAATRPAPSGEAIRPAE